MFERVEVWVIREVVGVELPNDLCNDLCYVILRLEKRLTGMELR